MKSAHCGLPLAAPSKRPARRSLTFRQWSALLISACIVPATIAACVLIFGLYHQGRASIEAATLHTARALMQAVDRELSRVEGMAVALSTAPGLASGDLTVLAGQVARLVPYGLETNIVLWNRQGNQLINAHHPNLATVRQFPLPQSVLRVFDSGRTAVSDLYTGPVTGRRLTSVDVPVALDGKTNYVLSGQIYTEQLQRILTGQKIPASWVMALVDSSGLVVARTRDPQKYIGKPATATLRARMALTDEGIFPDQTLEGIPSIAIFSRSAVSRWTLVIGVHRDALTESLWTAIGWLELGVLILFVLGLGLARMVGTRIAASLRGLVGPAIALGEGRPVTLPAFQLREADEVGQALLQASALLRRRTVERDAAAQAEHQLREGKQEVERSEAFLRGVFEESPDAVLLVAPDGALVRVNAEAEHLFAYPPGALTALHVDDVLQAPAADGRGARDILGAALARRQCSERFMLQGRRGDGSTFPVDLMRSTLTGNGRGLTIATIRDVSDRERGEAALRESEMRFRSTLEHAPIGIATLSLEGDWIEGNAAVCDIVGYDKEALRGMRSGALVHPDDLALDREQFGRLLRGEDRVNQSELRLLHRDGHAVPVLLTRTVLRDEAGRPLHWIVQVQDISERKRTEQELTTLNKRLALATRAGGIAVWDWDLVTDKLVGDEHMYQLYQIEQTGPRDTAAALWDARVHPQDRERVAREVRQAIQEGQEYATEFRIVWPGGEVRHIRANAIISRAPDGKALHMTGANMDVIESRQTESAIRSALREKETLLKELYHRVKNNLQLITSLFTLQARTLAPGVARTALTEGANRVQAMALVHEKLYQSGELSSIMLDAYVKDLCVQLGATAAADARGIALQAEVEPIELGIDTAVPVGLLLSELISNSLKHAFPDGRRGRIVVRVAMDEAGSIELRVSDNGIGFPADMEQTSSRALGLKLVAALSRQLGADAYTRQNSDGACVSVVFRPAVARAVAAGPDRRENDVHQWHQPA